MRQAGVSVKDSIRVSRSKGYDKYELPIAPYVKGAETSHEQQKAMVQYNPPGASRWGHSNLSGPAQLGPIQPVITRCAVLSAAPRWRVWLGPR